MRKNLYFSKELNRYLTEEDSIPIGDTLELKNDKKFFLHNLGFPIFLSESRIKHSDEYLEQDPYCVEEKFSDKFHQRRLTITLNLIKKIVSSNSKLVDLGCGEGHFTARFLKFINSDNLYGLDYSISAIKKAKSAFQDIEFCVADVFDLPYPDGYFDIVVCNNLIEHIENPVLLLKNIKRILKKDGHIIISTPSRYRLDNVARIIQGKRIQLISKYHVTEYSVGQIIELLSYSGFKIKTIISKSITKSNGIKKTITNIIVKIIKFFIQRWLNRIGAPYTLEATVFFLAQKVV
ncbi:MAG: class I SAM-dependent methyltransferase [Promethearchaeota archaeon]